MYLLYISLSSGLVFKHSSDFFIIPANNVLLPWSFFCDRSNNKLLYISISFKLFPDNILNSVINLNILYCLLKNEEKPINIKPKITNNVISFVLDIFLKNIQILNQEVKYHPKWCNISKVLS